MSPLIERPRWLAGIAELMAAFVSSGGSLTADLSRGGWLALCRQGASLTGVSDSIEPGRGTKAGCIAEIAAESG